MTTVKERISQYRYGVMALAVLMLKFILNLGFFDIRFFPFFLVQLVLAAALAGRFVNRFPGSKSSGLFFSLIFVIMFIVSYSDRIVTGMVQPPATALSLVFYLLSLVLLTFPGLALISLPLSLAGVIMNPNFVVMCLPALLMVSVAAADFGNKAENSTVPEGKYDRFIPAGYGLLVIAGIVRFALYAKKMFLYEYAFPSAGIFFRNIRLSPVDLIPLTLIFVIVLIGVKKNGGSLRLPLAGILIPVAVFAGELFTDRNFVTVQLYNLCAVTGVFAYAMTLSLREGKTGEAQKKALEGLYGRYHIPVMVIIIVFLVALRAIDY